MADVSQYFIINMIYTDDMYMSIGSECLEDHDYDIFLLEALTLEKPLSLGFPFLIYVSELDGLLHKAHSCRLFGVGDYHKVCPWN